MSKKLLVLFVSALLLNACSSPEPKLSYDPVELIEYERCLNTIPVGLIDPIGLMKRDYNELPAWISNEVLWGYEGFPEKYCESKKPILK